MQSLTNIAMIQKLKTLKDLLLNTEKQISTTKSIAAIIGGTGGRNHFVGSPMSAAIPTHTDTEGLTMPVLAVAEGMCADMKHADTILVYLSMAERAMRAAAGDSIPLL